MAEQKTIKGVLKEVDIKEGAKDGKAWKRATLKIDVNGDMVVMGTFNSEDITLANKLKWKNVEAVFVTNGQYQNLVKGGLKEGDGDVPVETVEDAQVKPAESAKTPESLQKVANYQANDTKRQQMIVQQSCDKLALEYGKLLISAVEAGILSKEEFSKEDLNFAKLMEMSDKRAKEILDGNTKS